MRRRQERTMEERFLRPREPEERRRPGGRLARGLLRYVAFVAVAAGVSVGIALLIGLFTDSSVTRAASLGLFIGGALIIAVPLLQGGMPPMSQPEIGYEGFDLSAQARRRWQAQAWGYLAIGLSLIGLGVLVEVFAG